MCLGWVNGQFFRILKIKLFYFVVAICDLVQDVETVKGKF